MRFAKEVAVEPKFVEFRVCVILPNAGSLILSTGIAKCGVLVRLNALPPGLQPHVVLHGDELDEPQVEVVVGGAADDVAAGVAGQQRLPSAA